MRVLYFMNHVDQGGAALALYDLIAEIKRNHKEIEPVVITGKYNKLNEMFNTMGVENHVAPYKNFISSYHSPEFFWKTIYYIRYHLCQRKAIRQIERDIDLNTIDIIHTNLNRIDVGAIISQKYGIPHVWHVREFGKGDFKLLSFKNDPVKYMNSYVSMYVFISKSVKDYWVREGIADTGTVIYDGIRTELYLKGNYYKNTILKGIFLGGYCDSKGQKELLKAISLLSVDELKKIHIDFYGNGDLNYIKSLKKLSEIFGIQNSVSFYNYDPEITKNLYQYDVGFNCSISEGFGRVTVEYMMNGLCPIVSSGGANKEIVENKKSGFIYDYGDANELKECLKYALNHKKEIMIMGKSAKDRAVLKFSMQRHTDEIVKLYKKVISGNEKTMQYNNSSL